MEAPDIDGKIFFTGEGSIAPGELLEVEIEDILDFDLIGRRVLE
jgi:ribosomal protein S12 methylthiotransferase